MRPRSPSAWLAAGLALALAFTVGGTPLSWAADPARPSAQSAAAGSGQPLQDPPELVSHDGVLRARIVVARRKVVVGDRELYALTYNGRYMPPTLRICPGDRVELAMTNGGSEDTNLHVHGLHVSPESPSDDIFIAIKPGETYHYGYRFPSDITPGTYWYHSHEHLRSAAQVAGGESGIIIVDGLQRYLPRSLRHITEHVVALKDDQVEGDSVRTDNLSIGAPTNRTVNGQQHPVISIRPGETQLWRLANIGANIYYKLHLPGRTFHVIAQDGYPVSRVYSADSLVIPAGARFDVLVQGGPPGTSQLQTLAYDTGPAGNRFPQVDLATVVSEGSPMRPAALPVGFAPGDDLGDAPIAARHDLVYTENAAGTEFYINGKKFDPDRVDVTSKLNTVEEWRVVNHTGENHSFHVHTNHFQLMSVNGAPTPPGHRWYETVNVPAGGTAVLRIRFDDFTGKTVLHCHILNHEDKGMMAVLNIVPDGPASPHHGS
ncbi:multicopper oxidase family protein [Kitasatospora sp. RB6PN24]|uniref:multicopper oxidase family protein n=1 Tax=Kitasatospora humi TaxID=2893891 RepID=UPI001E2E91DF|nr:multicopper oxidase family protein [Kitasatospora humi]MCC9307938.1 multicopper oxidase family protein [Kitasatospora humi]